ncbi:MAG: choice-of-anchor D domain-containing protein, partial [Candidatus Kapabacteria bacterium]|nr:choice-of-anchor D domain-containing protein [Candidatus Kapabacteria bacterium]
GTYAIDIQYTGTRETADVTKDFDLDTIRINTSCGIFKHGMSGVAAIPRIKVRDFDAGTRGLNEKFCGPLLIENPGSDTLIITAITGYNTTSFSLSAGFTPALPISIPPKGRVELKDVCFLSAEIVNETKDITFTNNGDGPDSVSTWTGSTQTPGPGITGYDWLQRRVGTRHPWRVKVYNTGNQEIILNDVNFVTGGKYFPNGSTEANYVFKIGNLIKGGSPVTTAKLRGDSVDIEVFFRPGAEQIDTVSIIPVWATAQEPRSARLAGEGIIPKISSQPITLTCAETDYGIEARRDFTISNGGSMPLTISALQLAAGAPAGYVLVSNPGLPLTVAPNGGTTAITVSYTRPNGFGGASTASLEVVHDATPGTGVDATTLTPVGPHVQTISVASCSAPDISTEDVNFGRNLANCDTPTLEFNINNPSQSIKPLEIKDIRTSGPEAAAFKITRIVDAGGQLVTLPIILTAGQSCKVSVQFTPTEPSASPWNDRGYSAQFEIDGYAQGESTPFKTVISKATGIGFVVPVSMTLSNDLNGTETRNPGTPATFRVSASSNDWNAAGLRTFKADVVFDPSTISFSNGTVRVEASAPGWTITGPAITTISQDVARMTFTASGPNPIAANGALFSFGTTLLLSDKFTAKQALEIDLGRPCLVGTTSGDSTGIFNCALARRVITVTGARSMIAPVSPNPVTSGTAKVEFGVGISAPVTIEVINSQGLVVRTLVSANLQWGNYDMSFDTQGLASGAYFIRMRTVDFDRTQSLLIQD